MRDTTQDDKADTVHRLGLTTRQTHLDDQLIIAEAADSVEGVVELPQKEAPAGTFDYKFKPISREAILKTVAVPGLIASHESPEE